MSARPLRLSRDLRDIPVDRYRLPEDGRKWKAVARERMALAEWLATHGDPDGSRISPAVNTMQRHFGWSRAKLFYLLADLRKLKLLESKGLVGERGRRERFMNIAAFLAGRQEAEVQRSEPESKIREPESNVTLDTTVLTEQTEKQNLAAQSAASSPPTCVPVRKPKTLTTSQARYVAIGKLASEGEAMLERSGKLGADSDVREDLKRWAARSGVSYDSDAIEKALFIAERRRHGASRQQCDTRRRQREAHQILEEIERLKSANVGVNPFSDAASIARHNARVNELERQLERIGRHEARAG